MAEPFIAEIRIFAGNFSPRGWSFCDGQLLPIAQYTAVFSLVGTVYGGDGRTTFALPNIQGRAVTHAGNGPGVSARNLGQKFGTSTVILNATQIPSHSHGLQGIDDDADQTTPVNTGPAIADDDQYRAPGTKVNMGANMLENVGGGQSHNNLQPYLTLNYIFALQGLYPSRS
ncbi:MAG: tail fiber protein [Verrucomicrobiota bacterium]